MLHLRQAIALVTVLSGIATAAEPTTRPRDRAPTTPPKMEFAPALADPTRPSYVPAFARVAATPALQAERDHALMHSAPVTFLIPHPYGPFWIGRPYGAFGYVAHHGFMR